MTYKLLRIMLLSLLGTMVMVQAMASQERPVYIKPIQEIPVVTRPVMEEERPVYIKPIQERNVFIKPVITKPYEKVVAKTGDWRTSHVMTAQGTVLTSSYGGEGLGLFANDSVNTFTVTSPTRLTGIDVAVGMSEMGQVPFTITDARGNTFQGFSQSESLIEGQEGFFRDLTDGLIGGADVISAGTGVLQSFTPIDGMVLPAGEYTINAPGLVLEDGDFIVKGYHEGSYQRFQERQMTEMIGREAVESGRASFGEASVLENYESGGKRKADGTDYVSGNDMPSFTLDSESRIGQVVLETYNNGNGASPGKVEIIDRNNNIMSEAYASGANLGETANGMWVAEFNDKVPAGDYTIRMSNEAALSHSSEGPRFHVTAEPVVDVPEDFTGTYYVDLTVMKTHNIFGPVNSASPSFQLFAHEVTVIDKGSQLELISTYDGLPFSFLCPVVERSDDLVTVTVLFGADMTRLPNNAVITSQTSVTLFREGSDSLYLFADGRAHYSRPASEAMGADENDYSVSASGIRASKNLPPFVVAAIGAATGAGGLPGPGNPIQGATGVLFPPLIAVVINSILEGMRSREGQGQQAPLPQTGTVEEGINGESGDTAQGFQGHDEETVENENGPPEEDRSDETESEGDEADRNESEGDETEGDETEEDDEESGDAGKEDKEAKEEPALTQEEKDKIQEALDTRRANLRKRQDLLEADRRRKELATGLGSVILGAMSLYRDELASYANPAYDKLKEYAKDPDKLVELLGSGLDKLIAAGGFVKDKMAAALSTLWNDPAVVLRGGKKAAGFLWNTGKNMASGIWGAIKDPSKAWAWLKDNVGVEDFKKSVDPNKRLHERIGHVLLGTLKLGGAISGAQEAGAMAKGGLKAVQGMLDDLFAALSKGGTKKIGRGLDGKFVTSLGDDFVGTTMRTEMSGSTLRARKAMQQIADEHGVIIHVRPTNPASRRWLDSGRAVAKPMDIKAKTLNQWDELIGGPKNSEGLVGYFKPKKPPKDMMKNLSPKSKGEIWRQYNRRMAEFDDLAPKMAKLKAKGIDVVDGKIIDTRTGKYFTGDNDLFDITSFDGKPLSPQAKDGILHEMMDSKNRARGLDVEHPSLRDWRSGGQDFSGVAKGKMENAARAGGEGLDTIQPLNRPTRSHFAGSSIPDEVLNAAHSGSLTREMVENNRGILKHLKDSGLPIPDWAKDLDV